MATLTMEMGDHLDVKMKIKTLMDRFMKQQRLLQRLKQYQQQVFVLVLQLHFLMALQVKMYGQ